MTTKSNGRISLTRRPLLDTTSSVTELRWVRHPEQRDGLSQQGVSYRSDRSHDGGQGAHLAALRCRAEAGLSSHFCTRGAQRCVMVVPLGVGAAPPPATKSRPAKVPVASTNCTAASPRRRRSNAPASAAYVSVDERKLQLSHCGQTRAARRSRRPSDASSARRVL